MRKKIIIAGILLLIIGILLFIYGNNQYNYYKEKTEVNYIEIPNTANLADYETQMRVGSTISYIGLFILLIGIILMVIGLFLK